MSRATRLAATLIVALAAAAAGAPAPARADVALLDRAQRAVDEIDYEAARSLVGQALDGGGLTTAELARAYRLAGEIAGALDDGAGARDHFVRWLLVDPGASLPDGSSPKIAAPFAEAEAEVTRLGGFRVAASVTRDGDTATVTLEASDPLGMITSVRARAGTDEATAAGRTVELVVGAPDAPVELVVTALDARGNELAVRRVVARAEAAAVPDAPAPTTASGRFPTIVRWPTWTVVSLASAAAGGYFAYRVGQTEDELAALNADSEAHTFDEARALQDRGDRDARLANVGFGVAAIAAAVAVITFVLEPDDTEVSVGAGGSGGGVDAVLRF